MERHNRMLSNYDLLGCAIDAHERQNYSLAVAHFQLLAVLDPLEPEYPLSMGDCYVALDNRTLANESYLRALELAPDMVEANYNYGVFLLEVQLHPKAALPYFEKLVTAHPDDTQYQLQQGLCYRAVKNEVLATQCFNAAYALGTRTGWDALAKGEVSYAVIELNAAFKAASFDPDSGRSIDMLKLTSMAAQARAYDEKNGTQKYGKGAEPVAEQCRKILQDFMVLDPKVQQRPLLLELKNI